jgi:hypothetical protein
MASTLCLCSTAAWAGDSKADNTKGTLQLNLNGGYGFGFGPQGANPYGLHWGGRAGLTLKSIPIYMGVQFNYFMGDKLNRGDASNYIMTGAEGGFDIALDPVVLRLAMGAGAGILEGNVNPGGVVNKDNVGLYLTPGLSVFWVYSVLMVGADVRAVISPFSGHIHGITLDAIVGVAI